MGCVRNVRSIDPDAGRDSPGGAGIALTGDIC